MKKIIILRSLLVTLFIVSCDVELINRDIHLTGTPCYFLDNWAGLYYRDGRRTYMKIGSGGVIYKVYWNDSIIIAKNDSMKYEIIKLIPEPAEGVPWIESGYMSCEKFMEFSIDTVSMRQIDLSKHPHRRDMKNRE